MFYKLILSTIFLCFFCTTKPSAVHGRTNNPYTPKLISTDDEKLILEELTPCQEHPVDTISKIIPVVPTIKVTVFPKLQNIPLYEQCKSKKLTQRKDPPLNQRELDLEIYRYYRNGSSTNLSPLKIYRYDRNR
ncbi:hypothetical protein KBB68_03115 [Candidatus Babeliales bacterium]|nr:hypothetical protein [Candidatus Babeliales bacterium]